MTETKKLTLVLLVCIFCLAAMARQFGHRAVRPGQGAVQAVVVEDAANRTPQTAAVILSPQIAAVVTQYKIAWHVVDQAETGPDLAEVQWALDGVKKQNCPLPALAIKAGAGKPQIAPLPSAASAAALLRTAAGG
ncbi:MAG: hypothetical protein ACLP9L_41605 [Thermoguttaceae bacterium]